jgi:hypothetical protein
MYSAVWVEPSNRNKQTRFGADNCMLLGLRSGHGRLDISVVLKLNVR